MSPSRKNKPDQKGGTSISTHWLAKILGFPAAALEIDDAAILIDSGRKLAFESIPSLPTVDEGIFFATLHLGDYIVRGLRKRTAKQFLFTCNQSWYLARFGKVKEFHRNTSQRMNSVFVRSSTFKEIQQLGKSIKSTYRITPEASLLSSRMQKSFDYVDQVINNRESLLESSRAKFVEAESKLYTELFDTVESNPLTKKQREACIIDDDSNLVLAGPGTGKTSTMIGKAGYLVKSGKAEPDEILMVVFAKKAAEELQDRIKNMLGGIEIQASTFHKLGMAIIKRVERSQPLVSELATDEKQLDKYVNQELTALLEEPEYERQAVTYFASYLHPDVNPFDFKTKGEYYQHLEKNDIRSLNGDVVKSHGELLIANYLFVHQIEYKYEARYVNPKQPLKLQKYKPDFYLVEKGIYIEYYGIDRNGNTAPYIDSAEYNRGIDWKRSTHETNETICIESFYYQKQEGYLLDHLERQLRRHNVEIELLTDREILEKLRINGTILKLASLLSSLLARVKNSCQTVKQAVNIAQQAKDSERAMAALDLLLPILERYTATLESKGEIDFNDMIHKATKYVNEGRFSPNWKFILIDEFQDLASPRANLVKALLGGAKDCSLFCVGDDWQSIYRFAGSDLKYTTEFGQEFGLYSLTKLDRSYRLNNSICDVATKFVTQNPIQQKKSMTTNERVSKSAISVMRVRDCCDLCHIDKALKRISKIAQAPSSVYVLSRYNFSVDKKVLSLTGERYPNLTVSALSMHASKGKEADYVIVVGLERGKNGFPSEKMTHPLLELYLPPKEEYLNAEERRLFYVAITRAKKRVYLIADMSRASTFMIELLEESEYDLCLDEFGTSIEQEKYKAISCPECSAGTLLIRRNGKTNAKFTACSNYKRCTHTEPCCEKCDSIMTRQGDFKICIKCGWRKMPGQRGSRMRKGFSTDHWGFSNY